MTETTADANGAGGSHDAGVEVSDIEKSIKPDTDKVEDVAIHISNAATPTDEEQAKPTSNVTPTPSSIFDDGGEAFFHCEKRDFVWSNVNMKLLNKKNGGVGDDTRRADNNTTLIAATSFGYSFDSFLTNYYTPFVIFPPCKHKYPNTLLI